MNDWYRNLYPDNPIKMRHLIFTTAVNFLQNVL